jgi:hypothetical protein
MGLTTPETVEEAVPVVEVPMEALEETVVRETTEVPVGTLVLTTLPQAQNQTDRESLPGEQVHSITLQVLLWAEVLVLQALTARQWLYST